MQGEGKGNNESRVLWGVPETERQDNAAPCVVVPENVVHVKSDEFVLVLRVMNVLDGS